jgi:hypothetical protein
MTPLHAVYASPVRVKLLLLQCLTHIAANNTYAITLFVILFTRPYPYLNNVNKKFFGNYTYSYFLQILLLYCKQSCYHYQYFPSLDSQLLL